MDLNQPNRSGTGPAGPLLKTLRPFSNASDSFDRVHFLSQSCVCDDTCVISAVDLFLIKSVFYECSSV